MLAPAPQSTWAVTRSQRVAGLHSSVYSGLPRRRIRASVARQRAILDELIRDGRVVLTDVVFPVRAVVAIFCVGELWVVRARR